MITLITGGAKSGKTSHALSLAEAAGPARMYMATAQALDDEMRERIKRHKEERGNGWDTLEEPVNVPLVLSQLDSKYDAVLLDCLTLWLTNLMCAGRDIEADASALLEVLSNVSADVIVVTNEVGLGIVPDNQMAREFRDHAGALNQSVASLADRVLMTVSGIVVQIK